MLKPILEYMPDGRLDERLIRGAASGMSESVPSDGGFLIQQDFTSELLKRTYETGIIASRCRKLPISTNANGMKINAIDENSRATGSRLGGIRAYWAAEAETVAASKPKFRQMELNLQKLIGLCYATDELLADQATLESVLMDGFAEEFGFLVDDAVIRGTGVGMPLGILNSNAVVTVPKENAQAARSLTAENIINMWARLWARSQPNAVWLINQDIIPELYQLKIPIGTAGQLLYMPANGLSEMPYGTLFGRPVIPVEYCETLGTKGDIILADFGQYVIADKGGVTSAVSIHVRFIYDEQCFRFTYRVSGQSFWNAPLSPYRGTNTISPFVVLETRV
ncbi:major capsid protein HK97 [Desulfofarcimen acetoxidans DSM 771]|uniref:Major capsid protein HK97 n=1 Tax=Desulfofarcimen acetoxidans (strain ATCC 49208 / DSM 771 / KCTC 5769 / VKM B-1644 / 5575) TaxID=485916 RepID=C8VWL1_DESAS|nr:phage major capsid protein [Desulfofarcimen acetoxidans]ACV64375.1 major capsid protein HK97 [Desulfofarcimen acetoxidans DSM 771]